MNWVVLVVFLFIGWRIIRGWDSYQECQFCGAYVGRAANVCQNCVRILTENK